MSDEEERYSDTGLRKTPGRRPAGNLNHDQFFKSMGIAKPDFPENDEPFEARSEESTRPTKGDQAQWKREARQRDQEAARQYGANPRQIHRPPPSPAEQAGQDYRQAKKTAATLSSLARKAKGRGASSRSRTFTPYSRTRKKFW